MKLEHPLIWMMIQKCILLNFILYPAILAFDAPKRQTLLTGLPWIYLALRLVYPIMILNIKLTHIFFPLGKNALFTNKLLSVTQCSYRLFRKDEMISCHVGIGQTQSDPFILKNDHPPYCEHCQSILIVRHNVLECNNLTQIRKDIFGRRYGGINTVIV